jgi:hypothetical protein
VFVAWQTYTVLIAGNSPENPTADPTKHSTQVNRVIVHQSMILAVVVSPPSKPTKSCDEVLYSEVNGWHKF